MGEILLEWARNIIFFMVFLSVISHLLADASYEKYIRFFAGIVLILITVSPLKGGLDFQEKAGRFFEEFSFFAPRRYFTSILHDPAFAFYSAPLCFALWNEKCPKPKCEMRNER